MVKGSSNGKGSEIYPHTASRIHAYQHIQKVERRDQKVQVIANSVVVTVRLYYQDVLSDEILWQDGIGASPIQTDKGAGAMDWNHTKNDAVMKAAPAAESYAVKDAAEKIGKLFGKDMNRADRIMYDTPPIS